MLLKSLTFPWRVILSCTRPGSRTCSESVSKLRSHHLQGSRKLILQNENVLFRRRCRGDGEFHPSVCEEASVQKQVRPEERISHHGQRWFYKRFQRDVSAASVCPLFVILQWLFCFDRPLLCAGCSICWSQTLGLKWSLSQKAVKNLHALKLVKNLLHLSQSTSWMAADSETVPIACFM